MQNLTPYAAAQVANKVFELKGLNASITPQMMYGYARNQRIETVPDSKPVQFVGDAFKEWLDQYVKKIETGETTTRTDFDKLAAEFV